MPTKILDWLMNDRTPCASQYVPETCSTTTYSISNNSNCISCSQTRQSY